VEVDRDAEKGPLEPLTSSTELLGDGRDSKATTDDDLFTESKAGVSADHSGRAHRDYLSIGEDGSQQLLTLSSDMMVMMSRSSATSTLFNAESSMLQMREWVDFAAEFHKVKNMRIRAEELRTRLSGELEEFREANAFLSHCLRAFQESTTDERALAKLLSQTYTVSRKQEELEVAQENVRKADDELIAEEFQISQRLPGNLPDDYDTIAALHRHPTGESKYSTPQYNDDLAWESGNDAVESALRHIDDLESDILRLRERRTTLFHELVTDVQDNTEAEDTANKQLEEYERQETSRMEDLKAALIDLDAFRPRTNTIEVLEQSSASHEPSVDGSVSISQTVEVDENTLFDQWKDTISYAVFLSLRKLLHSEQMQNLGVFPAPLVRVRAGRANYFDMINAWLFHQLRTSDEQLVFYMATLKKADNLYGAPVIDALGPEGIFKAALLVWHRDVPNRPSGYQQHNTTVRTNLGEDHSAYLGLLSYDRWLRIVEL
jgi:hypothetical protein